MLVTRRTQLWARAVAAALALASTLVAVAATDDQQGAWASEVLAMSGPDSQQNQNSPRVETPPGFAGASFTCVTTGDASRGSCFVSNCLQLVGAVRSGVAHITLYRNLTSSGSSGGGGTFGECDFPLTITRPLTIRGACASSPGGSGGGGNNGAACVIDGGGRLTRRPRDSCRQHCTTCQGGGRPIFDVRPGG
jgi:hypothetical protein